MSTIDKGGKVTRKTLVDQFMAEVVSYANGRIENGISFDAAGNASWVGKSTFGVDSFGEVNVSGQTVSASALANLFQVYAYNLTAIRRVQLKLIETTTSVSMNGPSNGSISLNVSGSGSATGSRSVSATANATTSVAINNYGTSKITTLGAEYRMNLSNFNSTLNFATNFPNLHQGLNVTAKDFNDLFAALKKIIDDNIDLNPGVNITSCHSSTGGGSRTGTGTVTATCCHASCHSSCHGSRGRR